MSRTHKLFMWGYQFHFCKNLEILAREVIKNIAPIIYPKSMLVGIRKDGDVNKYPVCLQPEDGQWDPSIFENCKERADEIYSEHPDHEILYGDAPRMRDKPERIRKKSVLQAVQEVTNKYDLKHNTRTYRGWPTVVNGFYVVPILQFRETELGRYPALSERISWERWTSSIGLVESVIEELLMDAAKTLEEEEPGRYPTLIEKDTTTILRKAGKQFCNAISLFTRTIRMPDAFEILNTISSLRYEGASSSGSIVFTTSECQHTVLSVCFKAPIPLHNHKLVRKIVEMSGDELHCICRGSAQITGLGALHGLSSPVFRAVFTDHYCWSLYFGQVLLMKSAYGVPRLPSVRLDKETFLSNVRRVLRMDDLDSVEHLWQIVEAAMQQSHGTLIVMAEAAEKEAIRLSKQAIGIEETPLNSSLTKSLSGIDGAILIDTLGSCHAVGVILDGMSAEEEDMSRGARYNSAIRYAKSSGSPTLCIVVSEDGDVNMIPTLKPQIRESDIGSMLALLKTRCASNYHEPLNWLEKHRFYLTGPQCDVVNIETERLHKLVNETTDMWIERARFIPSPDMNDSYFLPE